MLDLEIVKKVSEVEKKTGTSLPTILKSVPFGNVVTAVKHIPVNDLVDMVTGVSLPTLVEGLSIITPKEISSVPVDKLKAVLFSKNMSLVSELQKKYGEDKIIEALGYMSTSQIESLLATGDLEQVSSAVNIALGILEG